MSDSNTYTPPPVWEWDADSGGRFANINRPIAGATHDKELPRGKHPFQLYSLGTPNGVKVTILFEESALTPPAASSANDAPSQTVRARLPPGVASARDATHRRVSYLTTQNDAPEHPAMAMAPPPFLTGPGGVV